MTATVRFAPSPTGHIHIGNVRTAILNWLFAKANNGRFVLRFDDTDAERSRPQYAEAIAEDLHWLGIVPDETIYQSQRAGRHAEAVNRLKATGRLYACYETAEELERKRVRQRARGLPPVYDRAGLRLTENDRALLEREGRRPHWRFFLNDETVEWTDLIQGSKSFAAGSLSDPVLIRADGTYLYTLPSVVDDIETGVSHVIRGEDHVANTAVQIQIFQALGAKPAPQFAHHSLLVGAEGQGLSKRLGSLSVRALREQGLEPMAVASLATTLGTAGPVTAHAEWDSLAEGFSLESLSRAPVRFDEADLLNLNAKLLHTLDYETAEPRLEKLGITDARAFWEAARANIAYFHEITDWWRVVKGPVTPDIDEPDYCAQGLALLPDEPWTETTWGEWTTALRAATGRKGRALYMPLRRALTGLDHGPELAPLLPLIGRERAAARLRGETM